MRSRSRPGLDGLGQCEIAQIRDQAVLHFWENPGLGPGSLSLVQSRVQTGSQSVQDQTSPTLVPARLPGQLSTYKARRTHLHINRSTLQVKQGSPRECQKELLKQLQGSWAAGDNGSSAVHRKSLRCVGGRGPKEIIA